MAATFRYVPPKIDARLLVAAAAEVAVEAAGNIILAASQPLVPEDTGEMKASGKVERDGPHKVRVAYERSSPEGYNVAIRQHEDSTLHHPGGGESGFLSKPFATEGHAVLEAMAAAVRAAL
jgi:hypothetical protein